MKQPSNQPIKQPSNQP
ncbi:hypothetical protein [uncultured Nostoc sp.]